MKKNPFATIDQTGVGQLIEMAVAKGEQDPSRHQAGHLRRTRRRSGQREVLPSRWSDLCELLAVPRSRRAACRGSSSC